MGWKKNIFPFKKQNKLNLYFVKKKLFFAESWSWSHHQSHSSWTGKITVILVGSSLLTACLVPVSPDAPEETKGEEAKVPRNARQVWTDDDLATLAKYIKKFPGGTADR